MESTTAKKGRSDGAAVKATALVEPVTAPFVVLWDSREQIPYEFLGLKTDAKDGNRPLIVPVKKKGLKTGDYSFEVEGDSYENQIAIERKTFEDLFGTLSRGRSRWEREIERLNEMPFAAIVIEASYRDIAFHQPLRSRVSSKSIVRSIFAFSQRYPRVHWFPMGNRALAEAATYRLLERFWIDKNKAAEK